MNNNLAPTIIYHPLEVQDSLASLGLREQWLWYALERGYQYKASLTRHNTKAIRGIGVWDSVTSSLAEVLEPHGFDKREPNNYPVIQHRDRNWRIAVLAGDEATGERLSSPPRNRTSFQSGTKKGTPGNRKGTRLAVRDNGVNLGFAEQKSFDTLIPPWGVVPPPLTYFLLHYMDVKLRVVRAELSLAEVMSETHITKWNRRIILTPPSNLPSDVHSINIDPSDSPAAQDDRFNVIIEELDKQAS